MDQLEPWVDVAAVRRLAVQLLAGPALPSPETPTDAGFGAEFVGYSLAPAAASRPATPLEPNIAATEAAPLPSPFTEPPAVSSAPVAGPPAIPGALPETIPAAAFPPLEVPPAAPVERRGPLLERLGRFRDGLIRYTSAQGVFILDREGKPVMDDPAYTKLYFLARSLAQAYRPTAGQPGNVHVKINANLILEVIPVDTAFGCLVLGAVVTMPLTAPVVTQVASALKRAATPGEGA